MPHMSSNRLGNMALVRTVVDAIKASGGAVPFADFMRLCLYEETNGYYQSAREKLGRQGDFYTSAHVGSAMGQCIAQALAARADAAPGDALTLMEWGGGDGRLAYAVLQTLSEERPDIYERVRFVGVESSPGHRALQQEALQKYRPLIVAPDTGVIERLFAESTVHLWANELLDAFPVHRLRRNAGRIEEMYVGWNEAEGSFVETSGPVSSPELAAELDKLLKRPENGQTFEIGLAAAGWIRFLGERLQAGSAMLIDYGGSTDELLAPHRMEGTLMCYRRHQAHSDPYSWIGEQDMTAHVDFDRCAEAAFEAGFKEVRCVTQKQFLVEQGILGRLQSHAGVDPFSREARANRAIRQLLLSDGMSELFKVLSMSK